MSTSADFSSPAATHRAIAGRFGELVRSAPTELWDAPAPVAGWSARDVVRHPLVGHIVRAYDKHDAARQEAARHEVDRQGGRSADGYRR